MKVSELIELLQKQPQDLEVVYSKWSEQCLLEKLDIGVYTFCKARPDGWVASYRPDEPSCEYLMIC